MQADDVAMAEKLPPRGAGTWLFRVAVAAWAAVFLAILGLTPASAGAADGPEFGVQFHGTWENYTDDERVTVLDALRDNGVDSVRIDVSWRMLEPEASGEFCPGGLAKVDNAIYLAAERGLKPLVTLWMAPEWANESDDERVPVTNQEGLEALARVAERLAERYAGVVDAWEFWGEPNDHHFMRGKNPTEYAAMLEYAYEGFKAGDPDTPVVFGGPSFVDDKWVNRALTAGASGNYDIMGVHPYMGVADEAPGLPDKGDKWRLNHLPALLEVMADHGDGDKDVWFTEFGWQVNPRGKDAPNWKRGVTQRVQAQYLAETLELVRSTYPEVTRVYWYGDRVDTPRDTNTGYGLVYPDGSVVPALAEYSASLNH